MKRELQEWIVNNSSIVKQASNFTICELKAQVKYEDESEKLRQLTLGPKNDAEVKTVLLLGEREAGKTAFFDALLNMIFGVALKDPVRVTLENSLNQQGIPVPTTYVTELTIYHQDGMPYPHNYRVIDTPGLDYNSGQAVTNDGEHCIRNYITNNFIEYVNSVGIIWRPTNIRLHERNQGLLSKVNNLLGYDIRYVTDILLTFCSFGDNSAAETVRDSGIKYKGVFRFENGPLYSDPSEAREREIHEIEWNIMQASHQEFLKELNQRENRGLHITSRLIYHQREVENLEEQLKSKEKEKNQISEDISVLKGEQNNLNDQIEKFKQEESSLLVKRQNSYDSHGTRTLQQPHDSGGKRSSSFSYYWNKMAGTSSRDNQKEHSHHDYRQPEDTEMLQLQREIEKLDNVKKEKDEGLRNKQKEKETIEKMITILSTEQEKSKKEIEWLRHN
ncbi:uncharacterized protein LOC119580303 [Penaeus monodon]|uniref:uncharacterized protein LOC119580303 n=1 Tax=Penaeus monodon TaxID=6687 RepID=UPI0018A72FF6|nr:uncharacterized protein LOC119580303 [Penaeus monodon]